MSPSKPPAASTSAAAPRAPVELVAIGASAGGVEVISKLLTALPADFPAAVAIVLHIPPDRDSLLPGLFTPRCALPVQEVEDKAPIEPGTVYFAAPDYHMLVEPDGCFALSQDEAVNFSRPSIDLLFESAAVAYRERLLAIVLTGGSADGAAGLQTVRQMGGRAWVQDPASADAPAMPAFAIERAGADLVTGPAALARSLAALALTMLPDSRDR
ncbi:MULTISPECIES: chemotaxis protein CheB [unclassified Achromobacter]|uniref:chemotaxis protein CheB n=1 Tax=unclassified Achromobacter TaxID=2626865 RepID=UPI000B518E15|nr:MULTISPECIES: chemotaxis protein CheB [unclassified Achromobacter]OWT73397.1 chemotaxis protein CheB [Achromobacter sp. HZ34]OWT79687.1 chemotaxis protein CheB [Achromobacter sp. HZ28]